MMMNDLGNRKGFTLVELMIVVAIIGILAAIAIPSFLNFRLKAKASEAKSNLGAIRTTEVAYYAEWSMWVGNQTYTPTGNRAGIANKVAWLPNVSRFSILGFAPEGKVFFDYNLEGTSWPTGGFTSNAQGDLDGNSALSTYTISSDTSEIFHLGATH
jgi:type IV pilus assembly protein PilA